MKDILGFEVADERLVYNIDPKVITISFSSINLHLTWLLSLSFLTFNQGYLVIITSISDFQYANPLHFESADGVSRPYWQ